MFHTHVAANLCQTWAAFWDGDVGCHFLRLRGIAGVIVLTRPGRRTGRPPDLTAFRGERDVGFIESPGDYGTKKGDSGSHPHLANQPYCDTKAGLKSSQIPIATLLLSRESIWCGKRWTQYPIFHNHNHGIPWSPTLLSPYKGTWMDQGKQELPAFRARKLECRNLRPTSEAFKSSAKKSESQVQQLSS